MTAPLSAGTRVTLTGTALGEIGINGGHAVHIDRDNFGGRRYFVREALQVVVPPEPQWTVGDALRIGTETVTRERIAYTDCDVWREASSGMDVSDGIIRSAWSEGRVRVLYCQKEESHE